MIFIIFLNKNALNKSYRVKSPYLKFENLTIEMKIGLRKSVSHVE